MWDVPTEVEALWSCAQLDSPAPARKYKHQIYAMCYNLLLSLAVTATKKDRFYYANLTVDEREVRWLGLDHSESKLKDKNLNLDLDHTSITPLQIWAF